MKQIHDILNIRLFDINFEVYHNELNQFKLRLQGLLGELVNLANQPVEVSRNFSFSEDLSLVEGSLILIYSGNELVIDNDVDPRIIDIIDLHDLIGIIDYNLSKI